MGDKVVRIRINGAVKIIKKKIKHFRFLIIFLPYRVGDLFSENLPTRGHAQTNHIIFH